MSSAGAAGISIIDRDLSGSIASWHGPGGSAGLTTSSAYQINCVIGGTWSNPGIPDNIGNYSIYVSQPHLDGIWDGLNTIQGVRTYDSALTAWTTPDAYKGEVEDPMSQQSYMWNRNNPYRYADPSGFKWVFIDPVLVPIIARLQSSPTFHRAYEAAAKSDAPFKMLVVDPKKVAKTSIPGLTHDGISRLSPGIGVAYNGVFDAKIEIGRGSQNDMLAGVAGEVFNLGQVLQNPHGWQKDHDTFDPTWDNVAEKKGAEGTARIFRELETAEGTKG